MSIPAKVWAHVTEVYFGDVSAEWLSDWKWVVYDARTRSEGAEMVAHGLTFEDAVTQAYALSTRPTPPITDEHGAEKP